MVGSGIPYSPFERAATRPKLNAMQFHYRVSSNFITGAPPEFEDFDIATVHESKISTIQIVTFQNKVLNVNLPDQVHNETAICMRMTKLRPFLEAQTFHHKLHIFLGAIIGCRSSLDTR